MGNRRFSKAKSVSDSSSEFYLHGISGGSGEHRLHSSEGIADDELEHPLPETKRSPRSKVCSRCKQVLEAAPRYCRRCYKTRERWMPPRPTRKLRKRGDLLILSEEEQKSEPSLSKYSNLRRIIISKKLHQGDTSSDEINTIDFIAERKNERLKRRRYIKTLLEKAYEDTTSGSGTDYEITCMLCRSRPVEAALVHEKTAHLCVCAKCAANLKANKGKCPACGKRINYYFTGDTQNNKHT